MGRLPATWSGRDIKLRIPYALAGEIVVAGGVTAVQFPDAVFTQSIDKPLEIHRMIPRVTALDSNSLPLLTQPSQDLLQQMVRARILDFGKNEALTKNPALLDVLTKGSAERSWEFAEPYYLVRSEGLQVAIDTFAITNLTGVSFLRISIAWQGFLLVVEAPSGSR
jgi:hypothetical protein